MNARYRIPLAALAGAVAVAAFFAVRPSDSPTPTIAEAEAADASADPGVLVPFLRFTGTGTVTVAPDKAEIQVGTTATEDTSEEALAKASEDMAAVIAKLKALGITDADLRTDGANTYEQYDTKRWTASVNLHVTIDDPSKAGSILAEANAAGAASVSGPYFSVDDQDAAYAEALRKAIENARAKAEAAAAQMGVRVTGVVSIDESPGSAQPPIMYAAAGAAEQMDADTSARVDVPVQQGTQDIYASVNVVFSYAAQ